MRKFCVFCGEKPVDKNKEHIIPQWLIKYTGDIKRSTLIGKKNGKDLKFPWLKFVFPACEECNSDFGEIEAKIQTILTKIDDEKSLNHNEVNLFLDWLDKIRIGMWLGHAMLQNKNFEPKFFINQRVASKDRLCVMYKLNDSEKGIGIIGTDTPVFEHTPSCFTLIINNMVFLNYSKEFLLSRNLGFPYPDSFSYNSNGDVAIEKFNYGDYKTQTPIVDGKILKPAIKLYQSIINGPHSTKRPTIGAGRKYYNDNCFRFSNNLIQSRILLSDEHNAYHDFWPVKKTFKFVFNEKFERELMNHAITQITLEHQNHSMMESLKRYNVENPEEKLVIDKYYGDLLEFNNLKIKEINDTMKGFYKHI